MVGARSRRLGGGGVPAPVAGRLASAGQQHGMVVLDAAAEVLRPAKLWNDTESAPDADGWLRELPGGARLGRRLRLGPGRRVHHHEALLAAPPEPDVWARLAQVCSRTTGSRGG